MVALALLVALAPVTTASGDHGGHRRQKADRKVARAHRELDHSTARLTRTTRALAEARRRLDRAERALQHARSERVAAVLVDERAQAELDAAEAALAQVKAQVDEALQRLSTEEDELRAIAVESFQGGQTQMLALSMVLTTDEPAELMGRLNSMGNVLGRKTAALDRLEAARIVLDVKLTQLEATRELVADRRELAARSLQARLAAEQSARTFEAQVRELTKEARERRQAAAKARAADLAQFRKVRREREHVKRLLRKYHAAERRRAARQRAAARRAHRAHREHRVHRAPERADGMPWPAHGWISSSYGMRLHPVYHRWRLHDGLDIAAPCGRPVRATAGGRVVARYYNSAYGNRVVIGHGLRRGVGMATTYNHLRRFSTFTGQRVRRGDVIGFVGSTGYSTGCHLHFMVLRNGRPVNPRPWLR